MFLHSIENLYKHWIEDRGNFHNDLDIMSTHSTTDNCFIVDHSLTICLSYVTASVNK